MEIKRINKRVLRITNIIVSLFIYSCETFSNYPTHTSREGIDRAIYYKKEDIKKVVIDRGVTWQKHPTDFDETDPEISNSIKEDLYNKTGNIIGYIPEKYSFRFPWEDAPKKETHSKDEYEKITPISPFYYIVEVEKNFIFIQKERYESITEIEKDRKRLKDLRVYLNEQKKDEPSPTILKKYINFQKYERLETIKEGLKIRIDLLHFDALKVGGASISKANYFQFNAKSLYVDIPPTKELPRFFIYGQSASIVSLFSHFRRFNDFAQVSVYGTTMSNGSDPIVLADYIFFSSPFGATFDDIFLKCENKDIDIRDFIK